MRYGTIPGVDKRVSRLVMGSMVMSTERYENTCALLDRFVEAGGTAVDTARVYGRGSSERAFGQWLRERGKRDDVVVIGKGAHHDSQTLARRLTPAHIDEDIGISLAEMQLDFMDMYILHKDDPEAPVGPIVEALNAHMRADRIGAFGGCWTHQRIAEANAYAEANGLVPFAVSSPNHSLAVPNEPMWAGCVYLPGDAEAIKYYEESRLPVFAWSSQARGFFSGRYARDKREVEGMDPQNVVRTYYSDANWERYDRAEELAREKGCTRQQVVLAWALHQPMDLYALIGPATVSELEDCLGALEVSLTEEEVGWLNLERERVLAAR